MRWIRVWLVAALVLALVGFARPVLASSGATITGHVYDANGSPIQGFSLTFGMSGPTTDADGSYSITVPTGSYNVMMGGLIPGGPGNYDVGGSWQVTVTGNMVEDFRLPALVTANINVVDTSGAPMVYTTLQTRQSEVTTTLPDRSTLRLVGTPRQYTSDPPATTDWSGHASFPAMLGSVATVRPVVPNTLAANLSFSVTANPTNATLRMPQFNQLHGRLTDTAGHGIPNAYVDITASDSRWVTGRTDSTGTYALALPDGVFRLDATSRDFPTPGFEDRIQGSVTVSGDTTFNASIPSAVPVRVKLQHSDFSPATEASVTRTATTASITASDGTPLSLTAEYRKSAWPDNHGMATTQALAGSDTTITVHTTAEGDLTSSIVAPDSATDPNDAPDLTITIAPADTPVAGVVRDSEGQPLAGVQVVVQSQRTKTSTRVTTAPDGSWSTLVASGNVDLRADYTGTIPGTSVSYSTTASGSFPDLTGVSHDVTLPTPELFSATVVDASDKPIPGVRVFAPPVSTVHQSFDGVDYTLTSMANTSDVSDAGGNLPIWALENAHLDGGLQQADGFIFPLNIDVTTPATSPVISMSWFGSVQSQGTAPGQVTISSAPGTALTHLASQPATSTPDGQTALVGDVSYQLADIAVGSTQDVTLTLPPGSQPTRVFKVSGSGATTDATSHSTISGNTIVMHLVDGGFGDADGAANGVIVDPLIPTMSAAPAPTVAAASTSPSLTYPVKVDAGSTYTFTGAIRAGGAPLKGVVVRAMIRELGSTAWSRAGWTTSDANGNLSFTFTPTKNSQVMWQFDGTSRLAPSNSSAGLREIDVKPTISMAASQGHLWVGQTTTFWGIMSPGLSGEKVTLQRIVNGVATNLTVTATVKLQRLPNGQTAYGFVMPYSPSTRQSGLYRVITPKDNNYMATTSPGVRILVS